MTTDDNPLLPGALALAVLMASLGPLALPLYASPPPLGSHVTDSPKAFLLQPLQASQSSLKQLPEWGWALPPTVPSEGPALPPVESLKAVELQVSGTGLSPTAWRDAGWIKELSDGTLHLKQPGSTITGTPWSLVVRDGRKTAARFTLSSPALAWSANQPLPKLDEGVTTLQAVQTLRSWVRQHVGLSPKAVGFSSVSAILERGYGSELDRNLVLLGLLQQLKAPVRFAVGLRYVQASPIHREAGWQLYAWPELLVTGYSAKLWLPVDASTATPWANASFVPLGHLSGHAPQLDEALAQQLAPWLTGLKVTVLKARSLQGTFFNRGQLFAPSGSTGTRAPAPITTIDLFDTWLPEWGVTTLSLAEATPGLEEPVVATLLRKGLRALNEGKLDKAIDYWNATLDGAQTAAVSYGLAQQWMRLEAWPYARLALVQARQLAEPDTPLALLSEAWLATLPTPLERTHDRQLWLASLAALKGGNLELRPEELQALETLALGWWPAAKLHAQLTLKQGDGAKATELFLQALERFPTEPHLTIALAKHYELLEEWDKATSLYTQVAEVEFEPAAVEALQAQQVARDRLALLTAIKATQQAPRQSQGWVTLANELEEQGRPWEALDAVRQGLEALPKQPRLLLKRLALETRLNLWKEAEATYASANQRAEAPEALGALLAYTLAVRLNEPADRYARRLQAYPAEALPFSAQLTLTDWALQRSHFEVAERLTRLATNALPKATPWGPLEQDRALALLSRWEQLNNWAQVESLTYRLLAQAPAQPEGYRWQGRLALEEGNTPLTWSAWRTAMALAAQLEPHRYNALADNTLSWPEALLANKQQLSAEELAYLRQWLLQLAKIQRDIEWFKAQMAGAGESAYPGKLLVTRLRTRYSEALQRLQSPPTRLGALASVHPLYVYMQMAILKASGDKQVSPQLLVLDRQVRTAYERIVKEALPVDTATWEALCLETGFDWSPVRLQWVPSLLPQQAAAPARGRMTRKSTAEEEAPAPKVTAPPRPTQSAAPGFADAMNKLQGAVPKL